MVSLQTVTCFVRSIWTGRLATAAVFAALVAGCQGDASKKPEPDLHELLHRYVMASPQLDECIEEWGLGPENRFEMWLELRPSGELVPLEVKDGDADLNRCLQEEIRKLRLPEGSVAEVETVSISIR